MDLGDIQGAHELDDVLGDDLPGHDQGEPRRVRDHEIGTDEFGTVHKPIGEVGAVEKQMLAVRAVVRQVVGLSHVPVAGCGLGLVPEGVVERTEVGQIRHINNQLVDPPVEGLPLLLSRHTVPLVQTSGDVREHLDQVRHVAAGVVDIDLEQDAVARCLVDLDVVRAGQQLLELGAIQTCGPTRHRHASGIQEELIRCDRPHRLVPPGHPRPRRGDPARPVLRRDHLGGAQRPEVLGDERTVVDLLAKFDGQLQRPCHQFEALELHLAAGQIQGSDDLLVGRGRSVGVERFPERLLDLAEHLVDHQDD